jgi:hypothetical protein
LWLQTVHELRQEWESLIGGGCCIAKPNTTFTQKWYSRMVEILDEKLDQIKANTCLARDFGESISSRLL